MTNFERWQLFMKNIPSPQNYVDFAFYFLVAASLQRRVWCGPDHERLFPNQYVMLVGDPGIGKGRVIKPTFEMLQYHKLKPAEQNSITSNVVNVDAAVQQAIADANYAEAVVNGKPIKKQHHAELPLIIPMAPDATTYEALISAMARSTRRINYKYYNAALQKFELKVYTHASLCFCLEELSSLFRKKQNDTVNFLIKAYDCGDYSYETKTQGCDYVKRCCLNFFGGTQPAFMETIFDEKLLNEGYASRSWFIYETSNRFNTLLVPELTDEQKEARQTLIDHIGKLTKLYGPVKYEPAAWDYLENWWKNIHPIERPNMSAKLSAYYARKNIHVQKLAMAMHFGEDAEQDENGFPLNPISLATCKAAMDKLADIEKRMHYALSFHGNNPLAVISRKLLTYLKKNGPQSKNELLLEFWDDCKENELQDIINHLQMVNKIQLREVTTPKGVFRKWALSETSPD